MLKKGNGVVLSTRRIVDVSEGVRPVDHGFVARELGATMEAKIFPTLYGKASNGKVKMWNIQVRLDDEGVPEIYCTHGYTDGKQAEEVKKIKVGKNIGKKHETTPWQQAVSEAESTWKKKQDKGYGTSPDELKEPILPMLAQKYNERKHKIKLPCLVQPKLNGVRCLASSMDGNGVSMMSRGGKPIQKFEHLREEIEKLLYVLGMKGYDINEFYLDGEIFKPGTSLQKISGAARKEKENVKEEINSAMEYHVYDCFYRNNMDWKAKDRITEIGKIINDMQEKILHIKWVETIEVEVEEYAMEKYREWVKLGYEGIMFRNKGSVYTIKHRSEDLQKLKPFQDAEFEIVGAHQGSGNDAGTVVWECKLPSGKVFSVKPEGDREYRRECWRGWELRPEEFEGKMLTVRYQELSDEGVPIFPVGVIIRDYE